MKIIVVDDEKTIREGIARFIRELTRHSVAGLCRNGLEAQTLIRQERPDLVICDIAMPKCDGIELLRQVREEKLPCEFVLLSGYSDFEYARAGIRYGVLDYINKPINPDTLRKVLDKVETTIAQKKESRGALETNLYQSLLDNGRLAASLRGEARYQVHENQPHRLVALNLYDRTLETAGTARAREVLLKPEQEPHLVFAYHGLLVLVLREAVAEPAATEALCKRLAVRSASYGSLKIGVSGLMPGIGRVPEALRQSLAALYDIEGPEGAICWSDNLAYPIRKASQQYARDDALLEGGIHHFDYEELQTACRELRRRYRDTMPPYVLYALLYHSAQKLQDGLEHRLAHLPEGTSLREDLLVCAVTMDGLLERFLAYAALVCEAAGRAAQRDSHAADDVVRYIQMHYTEDLNVDKLCELFYLNSQYFSAMFKARTGSSFKEYVARLRIEKAKLLLANGRYKVHEVAESVGYHSTRYFSRVFHAKEGVTPQEYRQQHHG